jgi:hypothetical protein
VLTGTGIGCGDGSQVFGGGHGEMAGLEFGGVRGGIWT